MLLFLALPTLIIYIFGIPFISGLNLFRNRHKLNDPSVRETFGFLYSSYENLYYWWELIIILRLVLMACVSVLFEGNPMMQATLGKINIFLIIFTY